MKLLVITYSYTPDLTPRAFRWAAVAKMFAQQGHEVHVLCAGPGITDEVIDGVFIHRVKDCLLHKVKPSGTHAPSSSVTQRVGRLVRLRAWLMRRVIRVLWRALYWPDYACGWIFPAKRVGVSLVSEMKFDWIISSSHPFSGHVVGHFIKKYAKSSRWMVDISDPFSLMKDPSPNNSHLYAWLNKVLEARILAQADAISVTTENTAKLFSSHFKGIASRVSVIPPLMSLPAPPPRSRAADGVWRWVFIGTLYKNLRSPRFLLDILIALKVQFPSRNIELHFYGAVNDCADDFIDCPEFVRSSIFIHGLVPREQAVQAMADADLLVNIGNNSETQLASKVVEYMAMGLPILNIVSVSNDISIDVLSEYPAVLTVFCSSIAPSKDFISSLISFVSAPPPVPRDVCLSVCEQYSADKISGMYLGLLE